MSSLLERACCQYYVAILSLALLAGCSPAPNATEAPTQAAIQATAATLPSATPAPTARPTDAPRPTIPPPTVLPPSAEAPIADATPQTDGSAAASAGYLIYQRSDGSLWRADSAGQPPISLTGPTEPAALLPWAASPDGKTIAVVTGTGLWYQFQENPTLALWLIAADGSSSRKIQDLLPPRGVDPTPGGDDAFNLVPALTSHQELAWSPDGQLLAFVSAHQGQVDLYAASLDGTVARLTETARLEQGPRWSPDGALIAYRTTSSFGTGAGWADIALEVAPRAGGQPVFVMDDRKLAAGTEALAIEELIWISPNVVIAGMWDMIVGKAEVRALDIGARTSATIFDSPYTALAWNEATAQLAIAGTSEQIMRNKLDQRKLAPGLFTWIPDSGPPVQIERTPVEALAWSPQGDALAYSAGGEQPGLRLWAIGAEGDMKPLAGTPARELRWALDGRLLATETAIYNRSGQPAADSPDQTITPIGWGPQGLFYYTAGEDDSHDLWLWNGAQTQRVDTQLTKTQGAGVVLTRP